MADEQKQDLVLVDNLSDEDLKENIDGLKREALEILSQITTTSNEEKQKDLLYLFNQNQKKKAIVRSNSYGDLLDNVLGETKDRILNHPEEMDMVQLMNMLKIIQDLIEKNNNLINGQTPSTLIQVNKTTTNVNVENTDPRLEGINTQKRKNINDFLSSLGLYSKDNDEAEIIDADITDLNGDKNEE